MTFKEIKRSIKSFFSKTDFESAVTVIEAKLNSQELNYTDKYNYQDAILELVNAYSPLSLKQDSKLSYQKNLDKLKEFGFNEEFLYQKIKANPKILEAEDEVELLSQALNLTNNQAEKIIETKNTKIHALDTFVQQERLNFLQNNGFLKENQPSTIWKKEELDAIFTPNSLVDNLRFEWHKLAETKKINKMLKLVDSNKMSIAEMRTILAETSYIIPSDYSSQTSTFSLPDKVLLHIIKSNATTLVDIYARQLTLADQFNKDYRLLSLDSQAGAIFDKLYFATESILLKCSPEMCRNAEEIFYGFDSERAAAAYLEPMGINYPLFDVRADYLQHIMQDEYNIVLQKSNQQQK